MRMQTALRDACAELEDEDAISTARTAGVSESILPLEMADSALGGFSENVADTSPSVAQRALSLSCFTRRAHNP